MASVSTYLNFPGTTEEAFEFYRSVFGGEFLGDGLMRFGDSPMPEGAPPLSPATQQMVMHIELEILGGHVLMGTDAPPEMGMSVTGGDNMHINLMPDTREDADRLFAALSEGGTVITPLEDMFWGGYFGTFTDRFGIRWMINHSNSQA